MSAEEAVTDALQKPVEQNAAAAEDVKKMLAELQEKEGANKAPEGKANGESDANPSEKKEDVVELEEKSHGTEGTVSEKKDTETDRRHHDRSERGDRGGRGGRGDRGDRGGRGGRGRGGRGNFQNRVNYRENIKSDVTTQEESSDPVAIRKQVEFYFSDSNLPNDKFLFGKVGGSQNNPVEIKILHSFKRMRHFQPFEAIVEALKESKILNLTDDNTCVQRKEPLPESLDHGGEADPVKVYEDRAMPRSIYAKGFGEEIPSSQFDIEAFFTPYGPTNAVRLRRSDTKVFKGSVFVEFESEELATKFLELDPKPQFNEKELQVMSKKEYCDKKVDDIKSGKIRPNTNRGQRGDRNGGRDFKRKRDGDDDRDWRQRRDEDRKNGFRDNKRGGSRNDRDSRGGRQRYEKSEKDDRGVPVVKATSEEEIQAKKDAAASAKADAIARAKAMVEAENKKVAELKNKSAENGVKTEESTAGTKRSREEDDGDTGRETKKVDTKTESEPVNGS